MISFLQEWYDEVCIFILDAIGKMDQGRARWDSGNQEGGCCSEIAEKWKGLPWGWWRTEKKRVTGHMLETEWTRFFWWINCEEELRSTPGFLVWKMRWIKLSMGQIWEEKHAPQWAAVLSVASTWRCQAGSWVHESDSERCGDRSGIFRSHHVSLKSRKRISTQTEAKKRGCPLQSPNEYGWGRKVGRKL